MGGGGGKGKQKAEGAMPQAMQDIIKGFWEETGTLRQTMQGQMLEALTTGGVGAHLPIIQQAEQAQRRATSQSLRDLDTQLAQYGLAGTPFGAATRANTMLQGRSQLAAIGPQYAAQLIAGIPGYIQGGAQSIFGALPGTRTSESRGSSKNWQAGI